MSSTDCLETTVVNTSGERRYFDFLGVAGLYLDADQEYTAPGSITDWLRRKGPGPARQKLVDAMKYAFAQGWLEIKSAPSPIFFDATLDKSSAVSVDNGAVVVEDPCYVTTTT